MPAEMLSANSNVRGGMISMPHPHTPGGGWTLQQDEGNTPMGTENGDFSNYNHPDSRVEVCLPCTR